jgi:hypothetical protein
MPRDLTLPPRDRKAIIAALTNLSDPHARFRGMVDERVDDAAWECDPAHPNPASCPTAGGCRHCRPISDAAGGRMVDTAVEGAE